MSPGKTEVKQGKFVEFISPAKGYFRETYKSQNINPISPAPLVDLGYHTCGYFFTIRQKRGFLKHSKERIVEVISPSLRHIVILPHIRNITYVAPSSPISIHISGGNSEG